MQLDWEPGLPWVAVKAPCAACACQLKGLNSDWCNSFSFPWHYAVHTIKFLKNSKFYQKKNYLLTRDSHSRVSHGRFHTWTMTWARWNSSIIPSSADLKLTKCIADIQPDINNYIQELIFIYIRSYLKMSALNCNEVWQCSVILRYIF